MKPVVIAMEYTLIDCTTGTVHGPFGTFKQARGRAEDFAQWEILDGNFGLVDWSPAARASANVESA